MATCHRDYDFRYNSVPMSDTWTRWQIDKQVDRQFGNLQQRS